MRTPSGGASRARVCGAAALCAVLAVLVYANALGNGFAYDDVHIVQNNDRVHDLARLPEAVAAPYWPNEQGRELGLWRPVVVAAYSVQWALWGNTPLAFHAVNVVLHGAVTALVVLLLAPFLPLVGALAAGLVFAVHPVHTEAVANVVGLAEILSSLFYLLACLIVVRGSERPAPARVLAVCLLYALAFGSKESAVTLPGAIVLLDGLRWNPRVGELGAYLRKRWSLYGGLLLTGAGMLAGRLWVLGSLANPFAPLGADLVREIPRIWTVTGTWSHYVRLLFFPLDLAADYAPGVIPVFIGWNAINLLGVALALIFLGLAVWSWRARPGTGGMPDPRLLGFGVLWFVVTISPISNVFFLSGVLLAERTLYLPSLGLAAGVGALAVALWRARPRAAVGAAVVVVALMGARTWTRTPVWKDNLTVFNTLLREHPESGRSQWLLGDMLFGRGRVSEGLRAYRLAVGMAGAHYSMMTEIGKRLLSVGRDEAAERILRFAWVDRPEFTAAPSVLALLYAQQSRWSESGEAARAALAIRPRDPAMLHLLARSLERRGRHEAAVPLRERIVEIDAERERWQQWVLLAESRGGAGQVEAARAALDSARVRTEAPDALERIHRVRAGLSPAP